MKNLIEEIEKLKVSESFGNSEYSFGLLEGKNKGINECLKILNQYNTITAPKSIKLSEIVENLNDFYCPKKKIKVYEEKDEDGYVEKIIDANLLGDVQNLCNLHIRIFDKKIMYMHIKPFAIDWFKWLYTLWIAGTEIIDDLKEVE